MILKIYFKSKHDRYMVSESEFGDEQGVRKNIELIRNGNGFISKIATN